MFMRKLVSRENGGTRFQIEGRCVKVVYVTFQQKKSCDFRAPENNKNVESRYFSYFSMKVGTFYLEKEEKNKIEK